MTARPAPSTLAQRLLHFALVLAVSLPQSSALAQPADRATAPQAPSAARAASPIVAATMDDALVTDANGNGRAEAGDTLRYTVEVSNTGSLDATGVTFSDTVDSNTTLVPGSLRVSPLAYADSYTTGRDTPLTVAGAGLLGNDTGTPAPAAQPGTVATAQGGSVTIGVAGGFSYTPPVGFSGTDSFSYTATNSVGSDSATVTVDVIAPPTATADSYTTLADTPLSTAAPGVLANDLGGGLAATPIAAGATAQGGTVTLNADGSFSYTPPAGYDGSDSFSYTVTNSAGSDTAKVTVTVNPPGAPLAADDSYTTPLNTPLNTVAPGVLNNDTRNLAAIDPPVAPATIATAQGGSVTLSADGSFSYTAPSATFTGQDSFSYSLTNSLGTDSATVTLTVGSAPTAADDSYTTPLNTALNTAAPGVLANDTLQASTITSYDAASTFGGTVALNADGSFGYTPASGFTGSDSFSYTLTNGNGSDSATVTVVVGALPAAANDGPYATLIDTPLNVAAPGVLANDTPEAGTLSTSGSSAQGGTVTLNADGSFSYTPASGFTGSDSFSYTITNGRGASSPATVSIAVRRLPTAVDDGSYIASVGATLTVATADANDLLDNDTLGAPAAAIASFGGGSLGGTAASNAAGASATLAGGTLTVNADGSLTLANPTTTGNYTFEYRLTNAAGSDDATVTIQVRQAPNAQDDSATVLVSGSLSGDLTADNGSGADTLGFPAATVASFGGGSLGGTAASNAAGASAALAGGTLTVNANGSFTLTNPTTSGSYTFQYRLTNVAGSDDATVTIQVQQAPTAADDGMYAVSVGGTLTVATAAANDLLDNDTLGFPVATIASFGGGDLGGTAASNAAGASATLAGGTLTVNADGSFTLASPTTTGSYTFDYRLTNAIGSDDATVTIRVQQAPVATADALSVAIGTTNSSLNALSNDTPGSPAATLVDYGAAGVRGVAPGAAYTIPGSGGITVAISAAGVVTVDASAGTAALGTYDVEYQIQNAAGSSTALITVTVNSPPTANDDGTYTVVAGGTLTVATTDANDLLDNDALGTPAAAIASFGGGSLGGTVASNAAGASATLAGGTLTVNADGSFTLANPTGAGTFTFQYRLTNVAGSDDATVTIQVQQAPTARDDAFVVLVSGSLSGDLTGNNGGGVDVLGTPAATVASFGGGSLGGTVASNAAGASAALAGGTLTVNADGSLTLTNPTTTGNYTFEYRLTNAAGSDDATVTIQVQQAPTAADDGTYTVTVGGTLTVATAAANDLLDNDALGFPAATIASFGGGSLGGTAASNAVGASAALAGGTLTVNANGSFTLVGPTSAGTVTFQYRLTNAAGSDDATVTIQVQQQPTAFDDTVGFNSVPGSAYHTPLNTTLTAANGTAQDLDFNDTLGLPAATITSFGAIQTAVQSGATAGTFAAALGTVTSNAAGSTLAITNPGPGADGSLTVNANGSLTFVPPQDYTGLLRFQYRLTNAAGSDDATVTLAVGVRPDAANDTYPTSLVGNTAIDTTRSSGFSVRTNDAGSGTALALVASPNGTAAFNTDGTFSFDPAAGFIGSAAVTYSLTNGFGTDTGTLTLPVAGMIWYVNDDAGTGGDGRLSAPLQTLGAAAAVDAASQSIFLFSGAYSDPVTLEAGERLLGQGGGAPLATMAGVTFPADSLPPSTGGAAPTVSGAGVAVTLATNNTVRGLAIQPASGVAISGSGFGTLTASETSISSGGSALSLATGTASATFTSVSSSGGTNNVSLTGVAGTLDMGVGALSGASGAAFVVSGGDAAVTFAGTIGKTSAGRLVDIQSRTGGSVTLSGNLSCTGTCTGINIASNTGGTLTFSGASKVINTSASQAVTLASNTGAVVAFSSGGLDIDTTTGAGLTATGGGTLTVSGAGNTITSGTGGALNVSNTTIGAASLTFQSISSSGGSSTGIILDTTGSSGGLTVTGSGAAGSGGTITGKSGSDGSNTTGVGIYLNNTRDVSLSRMQLSNFGNYAIRGLAVTNFALQESVISGTNGSSRSLATYGEGCVYFGGTGTTGLTGSATIQNTQISGGYARNVSVVNTSGTLNRLTISGSTFGLTDAGSDGDSLAVEALNSGTVANVTVTGSSFTGAAGDIADFSGQTGTTMDVQFLTNTVSNSHANNLIGGGGLWLQTNGSMTFNVTGNTLRDANGSAITLYKASTGTLLSGTVGSNTIGVAGVANSGSASGNGVFLSAAGGGTITLAITNNMIRNYSGNAGIYADNTGGSYDLNLTVTGNTTAEPGASVYAGLALTAGAPASSDDIDVCAQIGGAGALANNFSAGDPNNANDIVLGVSTAPSSLGLPGYAGATLAAVQAFVLGNNPSAGTVVNAYVDAPATDANFTSCATPPLPLLAAGGEGPGAPDGTQLTQAQLDALAPAAITRWRAAGLAGDELARLEAVRFVVADLAPGRLGEAAGETVRIDRDAAGWGWFVDATPAEGDGRAAVPAARVDLLTVVTHELGHVLGLPDLPADGHASTLMAAELLRGARRSPAPEAAATVAAKAGETVTHAIGTLEAGKRVLIVFEVTLNSPLASDVSRISSQGAVNGLNITETLTDDPATATAGDPTVTQLTSVVLLPFVVRPSYPDLVVERLVVSGGVVQVTVRNQGAAAAVEPFWVDAYLAPSAAPTRVNQVWQSVGSRGLVWGVTAPLAAGGSITLTAGDAFYRADLSAPGGAIAAGTPVYAQVDSANLLTSYGAVLETHELDGSAYNNIAGPVTATAGAAPAAARALPQEGDGAQMPPRP